MAIESQLDQSIQDVFDEMFEGIQIITTGGPGFASTTLNLHIYNYGLFYHQVGYAAAYGVVMIVFV